MDERAKYFQWRLSRRNAMKGIAGLALSITGIGCAPSNPTQTPPSHSEPTTMPSGIGATLLTYTGHYEIVSTVAWSPDGKRIASASQDSRVLVWNAA